MMTPIESSSWLSFPWWDRFYGAIIRREIRSPQAVSSAVHMSSLGAPRAAAPSIACLLLSALVISVCDSSHGHHNVDNSVELANSGTDSPTRLPTGTPSGP